MITFNLETTQMTNLKLILFLSLVLQDEVVELSLLMLNVNGWGSLDK